MKYTSTILALAAVTVAQTISDLPSCSLACVANGVTGVGCSITDFQCACEKADQLTPNVTPCVQEACSDAADQAKVITVLEGICASAGVPISIPEPGASSSAAPASSAPASSAPASSAAAASSAAPTIQTSVPEPVATSAAAGYPTASAEKTCVESTITVTVTATSSKLIPTAPSSSAAPYPTVPAGTGSSVVPQPSGTGAPTQPSSPPQFTGAASALNVPAGIAGVLGIFAYLL